MKLKRIILLAVALVMCISLCSCLDLDAEREKHAKLQDDGSIMLNGNKYVLLPESEELSPYVKYSNGYLNLTDKDVPLLFAPLLDKGGYCVSEDDVFILNEFRSNHEVSYYCREDVYDEVAKAMKEEKEYHLGYEYSTYDHNTGDYVSNCRFLTDAEEDILEETLKGDGEVAHIIPSYDFSISLERRTKDLWFSLPYEEGELILCCSTEHDTYYLLTELYNGKVGTYNYKYYQISKEHNAILDNLMSDYLGVEIDW